MQQPTEMADIDLDYHSEDSFVVVSHVGVSSASIVENTTSPGPESEESIINSNLNGHEEQLLSTPAAGTLTPTSKG